MKLRIKDNAVRFRLTLKEVELLAKERSIEKQTWIPGTDGEPTVFRYAIRISGDAPASRLLAAPYSFLAELSEEDFATLASDHQEGVYIRREWSAGGENRRFMVFVEKDRPGSTCVKPEEWIYEERIGARPITRAIPQPVQTVAAGHGGGL